MTITAATSLRELAFIVCTALDRTGETAVLSGGGAATIYSSDAYQSRDLDFILGFWSSFGAAKQPLIDLGFEEKNGIYRHPSSIFTVEFPSGPLAIGAEMITTT